MDVSRFRYNTVIASVISINANRSTMSWTIWRNICRCRWKVCTCAGNLITLNNNCPSCSGVEVTKIEVASAVITSNSIAFQSQPKSSKGWFQWKSTQPVWSALNKRMQSQYYLLTFLLITTKEPILEKKLLYQVFPKSYGFFGWKIIITAKNPQLINILVKTARF